MLFAQHYVAGFTSSTRNKPCAQRIVRCSKAGFRLREVVLFRPTDTVEPAAIGTLAVYRSRDTGKQGLAKLLRARKTGEATIQKANGESAEIMLDTATPVIAVIP